MEDVMKKSNKFIQYNNYNSYKRKRRRKRIGYCIASIVLIAFFGGITIFLNHKINESNGKTIEGTRDDQVIENLTEENPLEENPLEENPIGENSLEGKEEDESNQEQDKVVDTESGDEDQQTPTDENDSVETIKNPVDALDTRETTKVKGIYVTANKAGYSTYMDELIELIKSTELNAMVIDIKDDYGKISYAMDYDIAKELGITSNTIRNMDELVVRLKEENIYLIGRVVTFRDPMMSELRPDMALKYADGTLFQDKDGHGWLDPYNQEVWEYIVGIGKEIANLGFDEIQFDYVRFSTDSGIQQVVFEHNVDNLSKIEIITEFVKYVYSELKPLGIFVSADVYGAIITSEVDAKIVGQSYIELAKNLDYICPMIYPSHYGNGYYGIEVPDLEPYNLILKALSESQTKLKEIGETEHVAVVRPWLQDFTASWLKEYRSYGAEEIRAQIQGVYDAGYEEWLLWNSKNNYTKEALDEE